MSVFVVAEALNDLDRYLVRAPGNVTTAARIAVNYAATGPGLKLMREAVQTEVNFPVGYVNQDRLFVARKATNDSLEAAIGGRTRATSLARFAVPGQPFRSDATGPTGRREGVEVQVRKGELRRIGFFVKLRAGDGTGPSSNLGLAIRTNVRPSRGAVQLDHNLYLLYGPSVEQVFDDVAAEEAPEIVTLVESEFLRQFDRLENGLV